MEKKSVGQRILILALALTCQTALWAAPSIEVAHVHFSGGDQMVADPSLPIFKKVAAMTNTPAFRSSVTRGVSAFLAGSFGRQLNPASTNAATLWNPLVADFLQAESVSAFGGRPDMPLGFVLAIRLDDARAKVWQGAFAQIIGSAPEPLTVESFSGQSWKKVSFRIVRAKDWLVLSRGDDLLPRLTQYLQSIKQQGVPEKALQGFWLAADADWTRMGTWVPLDQCPFKPAAMEITIGAKKEYQKTILKLRYPEPLKWKSQPWRIPTETIRDPLSSFTAMQNVAEFLQPSRELSRLKFNPLNQQVYVWSLQDVPFRTYAAVSAEHSDNVFRDLSKDLPAVFNPKLQSIVRGQFILHTNNTEIRWQGLPFVLPLISAKKEKAGEFITVSMFPAPKKFIPAPSELLAQVGSRSNMVYYDWELTGPRLQQWRTLSGILPVGIVSIHRSVASPASTPAVSPQGKPTATHTPTDTPAKPALTSAMVREAWLTEIVPFLGNSVTEATMTGPNEVTIERSSHIGFTGLELVLLSHWLSEDPPRILRTGSVVPKTVQPKK